MPIALSMGYLANFSKRTYMNINQDLPTSLFITVLFMTMDSGKQPVSETCLQKAIAWVSWLAQSTGHETLIKGDCLN